MSYTTPLKQWCAITKAYEKPYTHTFLDNGAIKISDKNQAAFHKCYAWNILHNINISVSELRTKIFRFFIDIDFELPIVLSTTQVKELVGTIQVIIKEVTNSIPGNYCIVSQSPPKNISDIKIKNGIHMIWPRIHTDQLGARKLRDIIIQKLSLETNEDLPMDWESIISEHQDWETVIDESVYVNSGLRMMYSKKAEKCSVCKGKPKRAQFCDGCLNAGFNYSRPYTPTMVLGPSGKTIKTKQLEICKKDPGLNDIMMILKKTSIRSTMKEPNLSFNEPLPSWYQSKKFINGKLSIKRKNTDYLQDISLIEDTKMSKGCKETVTIERYDPIFEKTQDFIRSMWKAYDTINITAFRKYTRRNHYYYHLRTDSHYCHNIHRDHTSNHIWLVIDPDTRRISQRCFDTDCEGFMTTLESIKINQALFDLLFPTTAKKIKDNHRKSIAITPSRKVTMKPTTPAKSTIPTTKPMSMFDMDLPF